MMPQIVHVPTLCIKYNHHREFTQVENLGELLVKVVSYSFRFMHQVLAYRKLYYSSSENVWSHALKTNLVTVTFHAKEINMCRVHTY